MKYMGSKARFAKEILPIILKDRKSEQQYVEPFAGGMNMICEVNGNRIANDIHYYLIEMWKELYNGWQPHKVSSNTYHIVRLNREQYAPHIVGCVGFNCSYSGKWFDGFAGETKTKIGAVRDYQTEAINNVVKQVEKMKGVTFQNKPYYELELPPNSIVYCDPPYEGTTKYKDDFNHVVFWDWCREKAKQGHIVFVSEYNAPNDFECVWQKEIVSSLTQDTGSKKVVEKLFKFSPTNVQQQQYRSTCR